MTDFTGRDDHIKPPNDSDGQAGPDPTSGKYLYSLPDGRMIALNDVIGITPEGLRVRIEFEDAADAVVVFESDLGAHAWARVFFEECFGAYGESTWPVNASIVTEALHALAELGVDPLEGTILGYAAELERNKTKAALRRAEAKSPFATTAARHLSWVRCPGSA